MWKFRCARTAPRSASLLVAGGAVSAARCYRAISRAAMNCALVEWRARASADRNSARPDAHAPVQMRAYMDARLCGHMVLWRYACGVIWSMVHTKGGVGKTTTAIFLASAAARRGWRARVIDADPQGSASSWADRAAAAGTPLPITVTAMTAAELRGLTADPDELVIVDTPPGTAAAIDSAITIADLVIIPTGPRAADVDRVFPTLDITQSRPTTVLLTLVDMRTVEATEMPKALADAGAPVLRTVVRDRTAIERAFGNSVPRYLGDYSDVFDELIAAVAPAAIPAGED